MAEEVIELPGARLLELAKQNGVLEESIRRNQKQIDENTRKAQELETAKAAAQMGVPADVVKAMNSENRFVPMYLTPGY